MSMSVCLSVGRSVCVSASINDSPILAKLFARACYVWPLLGLPLTCCDTSCTFGLMDDVIFVHVVRCRHNKYVIASCARYNAPAASYVLVALCLLDDGRRRRASGAATGGGACNTLSPGFC